MKLLFAVSFTGGLLYGLFSKERTQQAAGTNFAPGHTVGEGQPHATNPGVNAQSGGHAGGGFATGWFSPGATWDFMPGLDPDGTFTETLQEQVTEQIESGAWTQDMAHYSYYADTQGTDTTWDDYVQSMQDNLGIDFSGFDAPQSSTDASGNTVPGWVNQYLGGS